MPVDQDFGSRKVEYLSSVSFTISHSRIATISTRPPRVLQKNMDKNNLLRWLLSSDSKTWSSVLGFCYVSAIANTLDSKRKSIYSSAKLKYRKHCKIANEGLSMSTVPASTKFKPRSTHKTPIVASDHKDAVL